MSIPISYQKKLVNNILYSCKNPVKTDRKQLLSGGCLTYFQIDYRVEEKFDPTLLKLFWFLVIYDDPGVLSD